MAHLRDNGRIVVTFVAFEGPPKIVRVHGHGAVVEPTDGEFTTLLGNFAPRLRVRSIITIEVERVASSCGYSVPLYEYRGEREQLVEWAERKGPEGVERYQQEKNAESIDGLPGLRWGKD